MNLRKLLGNRLTELLASRKIKQCELAEKLDLDPQSISRMVSGKHFPKIEHLEKIIEILEIEPQDLFVSSGMKNEDELIVDINRIMLHSSKQKIRFIHKLVHNLDELNF